MTAVGLTVLAHDEAAKLPRMLASVEKFCDGARTAVFIGAGVDNTRDLLHDAGFTVHERVGGGNDPLWVENTANELLSLSRGTADYLLSMQPNTVLHMTGAPELDGLWHYVRYRQPNRPEPARRRGDYMEWWLPNLIKGDEEWRYVGREHAHLEPRSFENMEHEEKAACIAQRRKLETVWVSRDDTDGRRPEKLARVLKALEEEIETKQNDTRTVFYLAQTYRDLGRYEEAAQMYERRIFLGGWDEEVWYAEYQKGMCLMALNRHADGRLALLSAFHRRPQRAEPLYALAKLMLPPPNDVLFIEPDAYAPPPA